MEEFKKICDTCSLSGSETFARIYYRKIKGKWKYLCSKCWSRNCPDCGSEQTLVEEGEVIECGNCDYLD